MRPFLGDKALKSTRTHAACTNGERTKEDISGLTKFERMPKKLALSVCCQNDPNQK
jgi:hypothetical protein